VQQTGICERSFPQGRCHWSDPFILGSLGASIYLDDYFFRTRPRKPDLRSGRIYPQTIHHGALVYLTRTEALVFEYSWLAFPIFAVPAYLLN
jgi:hypothetical protein